MKCLLVIVFLLILPASAETLYGSVEQVQQPDDTVPGVVLQEAYPVYTAEGLSHTTNGLPLANQTTIMPDLAYHWGTPGLAFQTIHLERLPDHPRWLRFYTVGYPNGPRGYLQEFHIVEPWRRCWEYRYWLTFR